VPIVAPEDGYLVVLNLFTTDAPDKQDKLLDAMREIVDSAAYPGWISSTMHAGVDEYGTANFIQWRSGEDLEKRYAGEEFRHRTLPVFRDITTSIRLLQTHVASTQRAADYGPDRTEIAVGRGDHTVIEVFGVAAEDQEDVVTALGAQDWLLQTPGYRSHTVLHGTRAQGFDGPFVVVYSQWADKASHDAYRNQPEDDRPGDRQKLTARLESLTTSADWNSYTAVHSRSAE
jgi:heme-degrading monooxygenase HmoA